MPCRALPWRAPKPPVPQPTAGGAYFAGKPGKYPLKLADKKKIDYFFRIIRYEVLWTKK